MDKTNTGDSNYQERRSVTLFRSSTQTSPETHKNFVFIQTDNTLNS